MLSDKNEILYVGKAKNIPNRLKSYNSDSHLPIRTERMLSLTRKLETTTTTNESEALLLEANLIKKHKPRFNILLKESIELVLYAANKSIGREIFVPKIPSYKILDLAKAFSSNCKIKIIGIRPGEKIHEELISEDDSLNTFENKKYYIIYPLIENKKNKSIEKHFKAKKIKKKFSYKSSTNNKFLNSIELKKLLV